MENTNNFQKEKFDSYLNKTIILSSRSYFKKQIHIVNKEKNIIDDENYSVFLQKFITNDQDFSDIDNVDLFLQLKNTIQSLTAIEQSVIFLIFKEGLTQDKTAKILDIHSKSVSRIKIRAIGKLKKYLKGDFKSEK